MEFRPFRETDLPEMGRIQNDNLIWNLSASDQRDGFLSVEFTDKQILGMHQSVPVIVAEQGGSLVGFLMGTTVESSREIPILKRMMEYYESIRFRSKPLAEYSSYVYGPVCVERSARGQGVLEGLFRVCLEQLAGRFELGVLFIAHDNLRSLAAHRRKLGMELVGEFEFNEKMFYVLVFRIPESTANNLP